MSPPQHAKGGEEVTDYVEGDRVVHRRDGEFLGVVTAIYRDGDGEPFEVVLDGNDRVAWAPCLLRKEAK